MSKIIYNPLKNSVSITIGGHDYTVDAESEIFMERDEDADAWKTTHGFLEIRSVTTQAEVPAEVKKEVIKEVVVDETYFPTKEVEVKEVLVEEPKKAPKFKK